MCESLVCYIWKLSSKFHCSYFLALYVTLHAGKIRANLVAQGNNWQFPLFFFIWKESFFSIKSSFILTEVYLEEVRHVPKERRSLHMQRQQDAKM